MDTIRISLAAARVNAELTQEQVAKKMNVGKQKIVDWEKGKTEPKVSEAVKLSDLYGIPLENIFFKYKSYFK